MRILARSLFCFAAVMCSLTSSFTPHVEAAPSSELLTKSWRFQGKNGPTEQYQLIDPLVLRSATHIRISYNLRGLCLLDGDASAIIFDQPINRTWRYISLSRYGKNCLNGEQTADIPLTHFPGLDKTKPVGTLHARIWHMKAYQVDINRITLLQQTPLAQGTAPSFGQLLRSPTPTRPMLQPTPTTTRLGEVLLPTLTRIPTATPTVTLSPTGTPTRVPTATIRLFPTAMPSKTPAPQPTTPLYPTPTIQPTTVPFLTRPAWSIQSVSSMKETKDRICWQRSAEYINTWLDHAQELGVNYVAVETPYDSPSCGDSVAYTKAWVQAIHARNLSVWHRHMPLAFEGIYNTQKNPSIDFLAQISKYIKDHPDFFVQGDIFTPIPEPQNGGIAGITYCAQGTCIFRDRSHFNQWLRSAIDSSETAFSAIGLNGKMKIGYYGFDGFVAWGDNNPDWDGILEDETVKKMGNITIDHYPEMVGDTMANDLDELAARYPNFPIIIGEWGTTTGGDPEQQVRTTMQAARRPNVVGFNYWHMGMGGHEELIHEDFSRAKQFDDVQQFYRNATE